MALAVRRLLGRVRRWGQVRQVLPGLVLRRLVLGPRWVLPGPLVRVLLELLPV